jgi:hypothetical protein
MLCHALNNMYMEQGGMGSGLSWLQNDNLWSQLTLQLLAVPGFDVMVVYTMIGASPGRNHEYFEILSGPIQIAVFYLHSHGNCSRAMFYMPSPGENGHFTTLLFWC